MEPIRLLSLFSGIGAFEKAFDRLKIPYKVVHYCEIDPYPAKAYSIIHQIPEELNLGDIKTIDLDKLEEYDLLTWGFPCVDISVAGKAEGLKIKCEDCHQIFDLSKLSNMACPYCKSRNVTSKTRSGLYFEGLKVLLATKPKYSIIENVKALTNKKNKENFKQILKDLDEAGYNNYWKVLNAKDFGVPQNRERVFIVSIRKDIEQNFEFPKGFDSGIRLKHILEPVVDEKYYIPQDRCEKLLKELKEKIQISKNNIIQINNPSFSQQRVYSPEGNAPTIAAGNRGGGKEPCKIIELDNLEKDNKNPVKLFDIPKEIINDNERQRRVYSTEGVSPTILARNDNAKILQVGKLDMKGSEQVRRVYDPEGLSPTLDTMQGGWRQPKVVIQTPIKDNSKVLCDEKDITPNELEFIGGINTGKMWLDNGKSLSRNYKQGNRIYSSEGIACSQTANGGGLGGPTGLYAVYDPYNRKLPKDQEAITTLRTNYSNGNAQIICTEEYKLRIRKLTPLECFLLMGFNKEDYQKLRDNGFSDTRLYKMAGNSIVVNVLEYIFMQLFLKK